MDQKTALAILKSGSNVFLTGAAGAGKTYVLNQYIHYLKSRNMAVAVTASTGIAATHMDGQTIHSWSGIGINSHLSMSQIQKLRERPYLKKKIAKVSVLIIDEVSMLHRNQLDLVSEVLQAFKENPEPFGGIQVVLTGDFLQLPPICKNEESAANKFAFMGNAWVDAGFKVCYLTQQHRTKDVLLNLLNAIRTAEVKEEHIQIIQDKIESSRYESEDVFPRLYTHNAEVDAINEKFLSELSAKSKKYLASKKGNPNLIESIQSSMLAPKELLLKIRARVMFVRNHTEGNYVNGTLGHVLSFSDEGWPYVETDGGKEIEVKPEKWHISDEGGKELASVTQIPLRLAWAITVHKSQGMTLDKAVIDLSKTFEKGQGFVALSRLRDWSGLCLLGCNQNALELDSLAMKADQRFMELSTELEKSVNFTLLEEQAKQFIKDGGGISDETEIKKNQDKITIKAKKKHTTIATLEMVNEGLSIEQIADKRGFQPVTIMSHIEKLFLEGKKIDPKIIAVDKTLKNNYLKVYKKLSEEEKKSLKSIKEKLSDYSYEEIRKAQLYCVLNKEIS